ncbi:sugar epimerase [Flavobacterium sp.]|uniref:sugar epimerase n=1 Tax=Flavobacterium sp. TaxID=239 RepID=UPI002ED8CDB0
MVPRLIKGQCYSDNRGNVFYNNDFDASLIKRIYVIENKEVNFIRGWQGHRIEQRWFSVITGIFKIQLIQVDNWEKPSKELLVKSFIIDATKLNILYVPNGYLTSIQSLEVNSKLLVMADYLLGETNDEFRFEIDYFKIKT